MLNSQEPSQRSFFLKALYEKKFYEENKPKSTLEKVILFQRRLQEFKFAKHQSARTPEAITLLEQESNTFRPTTNRTNARLKRWQNTSSMDHKRLEGPATSELRLILDRRINGEVNILTQNRAESSLQRPKMNSHREGRDRMAKIDMGGFLLSGEKQAPVSQRRIKLNRESFMIQSGQQDSSVKENDKSEYSSKVAASRRVFIGGRDLEKAAEDHYRHFKQMNKKIESYEAAKRQANLSSPHQQKSYVQKRRLSRKYKNPLHPSPQIGTKTEPKGVRAEDFMLNLELDPWNVEADYP